MPRVFFDTNILLYALGNGDPGKEAISLSLLREHIAANDAVLSTQVLIEFYSNATRKLSVPCERARTLVDLYAELVVVSATTSLVRAATGYAITNQFSIWDAMVIAAAIEARCEVLYTEDLQHNQLIQGVRIVNPFRDDAAGMLK